MNLGEKMVVLHDALDQCGVPHAFGGALALGWCIRRPRGTADIDLNLFVAPSTAPDVLAGLPEEVRWSADDLGRVESNGQTRLWWQETPVDLFFSTTDFHDGVADRARLEPFEGRQLPFLACADLAVFKAFFDRPQDWVDLENMAEAQSLDMEVVIDVVAQFLGEDDHRVARLRALA